MDGGDITGIVEWMISWRNGKRIVSTKAVSINGGLDHQ